jgi:PAS domain S-box-containing protein
VAENQITSHVVSAVTSLKLRAIDRFPVAFVLTNPNLKDNPIVYVNRAFERLTGYAADAAIGRNCRFLQGPQTNEADIASIREGLSAQEPFEQTILNYRADGQKFMNRLRIEPILNDDGSIACLLGLQQRLSNTDISSAEVSRQLREVQHRVKNHLQMVVSMIRLQSSRADENAGSAYLTLAHRVETLQLLYQEIGDSAGMQGKSFVNMGAYVSRIASAIGHLESRERVRLNIDTEAVQVPVDLAARLGLITSEIVTNAYQHAFPPDTDGEISVCLRTDEMGKLQLQVRDDGKGFDGNWPTNGTMGGAISQTLADGIDARIHVDSGAEGTSVRVSMSKPD